MFRKAVTLAIGAVMVAVAHGGECVSAVWKNAPSGWPLAVAVTHEAGVPVYRFTLNVANPPKRKNLMVMAERVPIAPRALYEVSVDLKTDVEGPVRFGLDVGYDAKRPPHCYKMKNVTATPRWKTYRFFTRMPTVAQMPTLADGLTHPSVGIIGGENVRTLWVRNWRLKQIAEDDFSSTVDFYRPPRHPLPEKADAKGNVIFNSSFELGLEPAGVRYTVPYEANPARPVVTLDETTAWHGKRSLKVDCSKVPFATHVVLPMCAFDPGPAMPDSLRAKKFSAAIAFKADRPVSVKLFFSDEFIDPRTAEYSSWSRTVVHRTLTPEWTRGVCTKIRFPVTCGSVLTPRIIIEGPAVVWLDAVQFSESPDDRVPDYAPAAPVEATFALDEHLFVGAEGPGAAEANRRTARFVAVNYGTAPVSADFRTTLGDFTATLPAGERVTREMPFSVAEYGPRRIEGTFASAVGGGRVFPVDFGVAMPVPEKGEGFFLGLNGCTGTRGATPDWSVRWTTTLDHSLDDNFRDLRRYGMRMIRLHDDGMSMRNYTQQRGAYDFRSLDVVIDKAHAHGLEPMFVFGSHGVFVNRRWGDDQLTNWYVRTSSEVVPKGPMGGRTYFNPKESDWTDFIAATVRHCKGRIKWYEIVNEPNITVCSAAAYARYLALAYRTIKENDPAATVVGICSTGDFGHHSASFVEQIGATGAFTNLDVVSYHPYDGPVDNPCADGEAQTRQIRAICDRYRSGVPMLQDEIYYLTYPSQGQASAAGWTDPAQALWWPDSHLVRRYAIDLAAGGIGSAPLSGGQHFCADAAHPGDRPAQTGAYFVPNGRFLASAAFAHFLEGGKPCAKPVLDRRLNGFVFRDRRDNEIALVWARTAETPATCRVPSGVTVRDQWGNPVAATTVRITEDVTYLFGTDLKAKIDATTFAFDE